MDTDFFKYFKIVVITVLIIVGSIICYNLYREAQVDKLYLHCLEQRGEVASKNPSSTTWCYRR